jgi:hypothetical protein
MLHLVFKRVSTALLLCFFFLISDAQETVVKRINNLIDAELLKEDVYFLSSDTCEGRATGTPGELVAANYIKQRFMDLGLLPMGDVVDYFHMFDFTYNSNPHGGDSTTQIKGKGINVAAFLDNEAPYTIVIGAHYDHLGRGEYGASRTPDSKGMIHYGADDNASGVAGVLALARYYTQNRKKEKFNVLFICFSGEELGLLGSKKYLEEKRYPVEEINFMINMDMIGRLDNAAPNLHVHGVGTADIWVDLVEKYNSDYKIVMDSSGIGPSDHASFYLAEIPVLYFTTGAHADYHTILDTPDKINYEGQASVLRYIASIIDATEDESKLVWKETKNRQMGGTRFKVTLGVMPDYAWDKAGLKIDGVTSDRPAEKAGIQAGDIIMKIGEVVIESIQDYMSVLGKHEVGDKVQAVVKRGEKTLQLNITF